MVSKIVLEPRTVKLDAVMRPSITVSPTYELKLTDIIPSWILILLPFLMPPKTVDDAIGNCNLLLVIV